MQSLSKRKKEKKQARKGKDERTDTERANSTIRIVGREGMGDRDREKAEDEIEVKSETNGIGEGKKKHSSSQTSRSIVLAVLLLIPVTLLPAHFLYLSPPTHLPNPFPSSDFPSPALPHPSELPPAYGLTPLRCYAFIRC